MSYFSSDNEYYSGEHEKEKNRSFPHRTSFETLDSYSTFFDYEKEKKLSEFLESFDEYLRSRHDDYEPPKTFTKK